MPRLDGELANPSDRREQASVPKVSATLGARQHSEWRLLVAQIRHALAPQKPSPSFRRQLGQELAGIAEREAGTEVLIATPSTPRELVLGAAIGSVVALAGGIVYLLHNREQMRARAVSSGHFERA